MPDKKLNFDIHGRRSRVLVIAAASVVILGVLAAAIVWAAGRQPAQHSDRIANTRINQRSFEEQTAVLPNTGADAEEDGGVELYGLFEKSVTNGKSYSNPYDYRVIELQARFVSPSGKEHSFFGFYDGDGQGGLNGNVWKLRFMPDETGQWQYSYSWTDGSQGGSGSFSVSDTGVPGPLHIASDNSWYFETARRAPFNWRSYSLHRYLQFKYGRGIFSDQAWNDLNDKIHSRVADKDYNVAMVRWPTITRSGEDNKGDNAGHHFWQQKGNEIDFTRYYIPQWRQVERAIRTAASRGVYVFQFVAMVDQYTPRPSDGQMDPFLRYMAARLGPYWNNFGYSLTWEYQDIVDSSKANDYLTKLHNNLNGLPIQPALTIHDHSNSKFKAWLDFSMRQRGATDIFEGNCRTCGQHGGVDDIYKDQPVVGSEDIWEMQETSDTPKNGTQVRRGAWGLLMAGVLPVYAEDSDSNGSFKGEGDPYLRIMWDFVYSSTRYRQYRQLNGVVNASKGQIASGVQGQEYLVYDQDGGSITIDLSAASKKANFSVTWLNPISGDTTTGDSVQGGGQVKLSSPYGEDSVLLLKSTYKGEPSVFLPMLTNRQ